MPIVKKLLQKTGLVELFTPPLDDELERQQQQAVINRYIDRITTQVMDDIESEKAGSLPHPENPNAVNGQVKSLGYVQYTIEDDQGERLQLSPLCLVSCNSIKMSDAYVALKSMMTKAGFIIELKENYLDSTTGRLVTAEAEIEEAERYFTIILSGW